MDNTIQGDVQQFHTLHPQKKLKALAIIAVIFVVSIAAGLYFANKSNMSKAPQQAAPETAEGMSQLTILPEAQTVTKGQTTQVQVLINKTGAQAADVVIDYDPKVVEITNIVNGDVFPDMLRSQIENGQVAVSAAVDPNNPTDVKTGTLFSFTLKGLAAGAANLTFNKDLTITATNGVNTLGGTESITITVE